MKKWDVAIFAAVAVLSLLPLAFWSQGGGGARVTVSQYGDVLYTGPLDEDARIATPDGGNVIEIRDGRAYMAYADCPDGLCLHGEARPGLPLVCLPNGVTVAISGREEADPLDGFTY